MNSRTMPTDTPRDHLAAEVIRIFLWSDYFPVIDKLACQNVCKTWREELRRLPLAHELYFCFVKHEGHTDLDVSGNVPTLSIGQLSRGIAMQTAVDGCCEWLLRVATRIQRVRFKLQGHHLWQLKRLLSVLQSTALQSRPELEAEL